MFFKNVLDKDWGFLDGTRMVILETLSLYHLVKYSVLCKTKWKIKKN